MADQSVDDASAWAAEWQRRREDVAAAEQRLSGGDDGGALKVLRVHQLDAGFFDAEISKILVAQASGAFEWFGLAGSGGLGRLLLSSSQQIKAELELAVHGLLFYFGVWQSGASYGHRLQNLRWRDERRHAALLQSNASRTESHLPASSAQRLGYGCLTVLLPYLHAKLQDRAASQGWADMPPSTWQRRLWTAVHRLEMAARLLALLNFLLFLVQGRYHSLAARLLGMRLVYAARSQPRYLDFEYMNQQLVWNGLIELLMFLAPLLAQAKPLLLRLLRFLLPDTSPSPASPSLSSSSSLASSPVEQRYVTAAQLRDAACPVCSARPIVVPFVANCGHIYCYSCLRSTSLNEPYDCATCATSISSMQRALVVP